MIEIGLIGTGVALVLAALLGTSDYYYRRRRRTYTRNPFSCSITSMCTSLIGVIAGIIILLYTTQVISGQDLLNWVIALVVIGVIIFVLYIILRYAKPKKKQTTSSSQTRQSSSSRTRASRATAARDDSEARRYASPPPKAETQEKFVPREDAEQPVKKTSTKKTKAGFFDEPAATDSTTSTTSATRTCPKCGKEIIGNPKFCGECGTTL
nr:hypothetical protein [Candidatus Sigynarchaeota archaeon]